MKKGYTLVSCIGSSKKDNLYRKTEYRFEEDGRTIKSSLSICALIEYYKKELKKVVIIGTEKSSWNELLSSNEDSDFFLSVEEQVSGSGISKDTLARLENRLTESYGIQFRLLMHSSVLSDATIIETMGVYSHVFDAIGSDSKLLIDITHGFRYMPMMLFQALQIRGDQYETGEVKQLYGEYDGHVSSVKDISKVWEMAEINKQMYAFESSFDGIALGKTINKYGEKQLGEWVMGFSDCVQKNYVMLIKKEIIYLRSVIRRNITTDYQFISELISKLSELDSKFPSNSGALSEYLLVFARILNDKGLTTQAIIALREALFTRVFEKYAPEQIGVFISLNDLDKKDYYKSFVDDCKSLCIYSDVISLNEKRNKIAHAGAELINSNLNDFVTEINFERYYKAVITAFTRILN